ncbi:hypothetical protein [Leisingera sp. ANG-M1]|uniref:hypothetical protein n=1 Tax=Leisingera sp. ANG-M1 TaxID=1577895 RepID=UPI001269D14F|nr:hypothetical protein [Leisingera sp. ANG-M1]
MYNNKWYLAVWFMIALAFAAQAEEGLVQSEQRLTNDLDALRERVDDLDALRTRVQALESRPAWPKGKYCVFRSGACPAGFSQIDGRMAAIWMYRKDGGYYTPKDFGNSNFTWHNNGGGNASAPYWHGEINLSVCCKQQ